MLPEQRAAALLVAIALEGLGVSYVIGGSFASARHAVMRATADLSGVMCRTHSRQGPKSIDWEGTVESMAGSLDIARRTAP